MGRQIACLLVALFVVVAAFVGMARAFSPSFDQCIGKAKADKQQTTDKEGPALLAETIGSYVGCSGEYVEANKNVITALALIAIAAFTCTLWLATSRQALLTREALVADKKAFVFPIGLYQILISIFPIAILKLDCLVQNSTAPSASLPRHRTPQ